MGSLTTEQKALDAFRTPGAVRIASGKEITIPFVESMGFGQK